MCVIRLNGLLDGEQGSAQKQNHRQYANQELNYAQNKPPRQQQEGAYNPQKPMSNYP